MDSVVIDTNLLLSHLTDRDPDQNQAALDLFSESDRLRFHVPQFVLFELHFVLKSAYGLAPATIAALLEQTLSFPALHVIHELDMRRVLNLWPDVVPHLTDAALTSVAISRGWPVATFDRDLKKRLRKLEVPVWKL
ncbi:MAG: PIN domain-containing protein [Acidobacteria bacterium]|nr:PIN domain-containing protein [Acidobacteriota bacterium]